MALGDRGGALEDSVTDEDTSDSDSSGGYSGSGAQRQQQPSDPTPDRDDDDDDSRSRRRMKDRQAEESAPADNDDDDDDSGYSGSGARRQQRETPVEQEQDDRTPQTGPTGPEADEGVEESGETVEQGLEETGQPKPQPEGQTAGLSGSVSQSDIRRALERGQTIANIEDKPAVASTLARMGATDIRRQDIPEGVDVDLTAQGFQTRASERQFAQQLEDRVIRESDGIGEEDVAITGSLEEGFAVDVSERRIAQIAEQQVVDETGANPDDIAIVEGNDGGFQVVNTREARQERQAERTDRLGEVARENQTRTTDSLAEFQRALNDVQATREGVQRFGQNKIPQEELRKFVERVEAPADVSDEETRGGIRTDFLSNPNLESTPGTEIPGDGPLATTRQTRFETDNPLPGEVSARGFERRAVGTGTALGEFIFGKPGTQATSGGEFVLDLAGQEAIGDEYTENLRNVGIGITSGIGALAGKGATIGYDIAEFGATAKDDPVDAFKDLGPATVEAAVAGSSAAARQPARTAGSAIGSAALSGGLFRATQGRPVLGRASRVALQPGEELVKAGVSRGVLPSAVARATPGVRRGQMGLRKSAKDLIEEERAQAGLGQLGRSREVETEDVTEITAEDIESDLPRDPAPRPMADEAPDFDPGGPLRKRRQRIQESEIDKPRGVMGDPRPSRPDTGIMGDPIRPRVETESEIEGLRKKAQQEEATIESELEQEMEDLSVPVSRGAALGGVAGMIARQEAAQKPGVEGESESISPELESNIVGELEQELNLEGEQELAQEAELEQEALLESELEQEAEFESEYEIELEAELELEREFEQELELELEQEFESEPEVSPFDRESEDESNQRGFAFDEDLYETGIADVDDLLREG
jgi:hypothetical protein